MVGGVVGGVFGSGLNGGAHKKALAKFFIVAKNAFEGFKKKGKFARVLDEKGA